MLFYVVCSREVSLARCYLSKDLKEVKEYIYTMWLSGDEGSRQSRASAKILRQEQCLKVHKHPNVVEKGRRDGGALGYTGSCGHC